MFYRTMSIQGARRLFGRIAARPILSAAVVGVLAFALNAVISLAVRMPEPTITDEFSYLLAADTFAHGRLTNPTHPCWEHFESVHINQIPTYASKYPPAQGMMLSLGQVVFGRPIVGVWISAGLACAALTWMLAGWLPRRWALTGGLIALVHPLLVTWGQNYWGGLVALAGGSLVLGALRRIAHEPRASYSGVLGIGLAILANSRPFEGALLSLPVAAALCLGLYRRRASLGAMGILRTVLPAACILSLVASWMLYYNWRVTGEPFTMPYQLHERQYGGASLFLFLPPKPIPVYRHKAIEDIQVDFALNEYERQRTPQGLALGVYRRFTSDLTNKYIVNGNSLASMLIFCAVAFLLIGERNRWIRFAILTLLVFTCGLLTATYTWAHYSAPAACLLLLLFLQALRRLGTWGSPGRRGGRTIARAFVILAIAFFASLTWLTVSSWTKSSFAYRRAEILAELKQSDEKDLVIVRYSPNHNYHQEWVYNEADIDGAPVVWAREMDENRMARLIDYFRDRRIWLLEADKESPRPVPYPAG